MNLIERLYKSEDIDYDSNTFVYFNDLYDVDKVMRFLRETYRFDTDLSYEGFDNNLVMLFNRLSFGDSSVCLHNMRTLNSRYNNLEDGCCMFNYSVDSLEFIDGNLLEYYSSGELFYGEDIKFPGVKLSSSDTSLYYSLGSIPQIKKYEIRVSNDLTVTREFSKKSALFILDTKDNNRLLIRINKPSNVILGDNYILGNELEFIEYLKSLESYDIYSIYSDMKNLYLDKDISIYPEITLSEMVINDDSLFDKNLLTVKYGKLDVIIRTIGDKSLTLYGNGNWSYVINDENVNFKINSGKIFKYIIETKEEKVLNDYIDSLLSYDVSIAKEEVERTKKLVKKMEIGVKKNG